MGWETHIPPNSRAVQVRHHMAALHGGAFPIPHYWLKHLSLSFLVLLMVVMKTKSALGLPVLPTAAEKTTLGTPMVITARARRLITTQPKLKPQMHPHYKHKHPCPGIFQEWTLPPPPVKGLSTKLPKRHSGMHQAYGRIDFVKGEV